MGGLPAGDYVALIGTMGTSAQPAITRAMLFGTLVRPDGWPIGPHGAFTSVLLNNVPYSTTWSVQYDDLTLGSAPAWTGMMSDAGMTSAQTCMGWSAIGTSSGGGGDSTSINASVWAGSTASPCSGSRRFYCIQQTSAL